MGNTESSGNAQDNIQNIIKQTSENIKKAFEEAERKRLIKERKEQYAKDNKHRKHALGLYHVTKKTEVDLHNQRYSKWKEDGWICLNDKYASDKTTLNNLGDVKNIPLRLNPNNLKQIQTIPDKNGNIQWNFCKDRFEKRYVFWW